MYLQLDYSLLGVDIGCGASCIYSLLISKTKGWKMLGLETNKKNLDTAIDNVKSNNLTDLITCYHQPNKTNIFTEIPLCDLNKLDIDFCVCNPPFFSSVEELNYKNRSGKRKAPKNAQTGYGTELVITGGEVMFVKKIIDESLVLRSRIKIYSSMLGRKSSVNLILDYLRANNINNFTTIEFCQGHTTRWGVAWSFLTTSQSLKNIKNVHFYGKEEKISNKHSISFIVPNTDFEAAFTQLKKIFESLKIHLKILEMKENCMTGEITCYENTWSNQRQQRRKEKRRELKLKNSEMRSDPVTEKNSQDYDNNFDGNNKRIKMDEKYLVGGVSLIQKDKNEIVLNMGYLLGTSGKDGVHQILQFIINNWEK